MTTAGELIKQLQEYPEDMPVFLVHYDSNESPAHQHYLSEPDVEDYHRFHKSDDGHVHPLYHGDKREANFVAITLG